MRISENKLFSIDEIKASVECIRDSVGYPTGVGISADILERLENKEIMKANKHRNRRIFLH